MGRASRLAVLALAAACAHPPSAGREAAGEATARTCVSCHGPTLAQERTRRAVHGAVLDDEGCGRCHEVHPAPAEAPPLVDPEPRLCNACHGERPFMRPHAGDREVLCTRCHAAHASDEPALLRAAPGKVCGECHSDLRPKHGGYPVERARCTGCHELHGGGGKLLPARVHEVASDCTNCHAPPASPQPFATARAVPALCFDCHPDVEKGIAAKRSPHAPARSGACTACHSPHASPQEALLRAPATELCGGCHAPVLAASRRATPHRPAADGRCGACHRAHGADQPKLLTRPVDGLCASCHPATAGWAERKSVHAPVQLGECTACHDPHGGVKGLLKGDAVALCKGCHDPGKEGFAPGSHVHSPAPAGDCLACHDPHAADQPRLLVRSDDALCKGCHQPMIEARRARGEKLHTPFAGAACVACHTPHAGGKAALRKDTDVCAACHVGTRKTWTRGQSIHPPFVDGACQDCHDAHGSKQRALLRLPASDLCSECHPEVKASLTEKGAIAHDPVKDGSCLDCHRGHGSDQRALLVREPGRLCADCHDVEDAGAVKRHGGYLFAQADCTGCHLPHSATKKKLLRAEEHMPFGSGDCKTCHVEPADPPREPRLKSGGLALCSDCHDFASMPKTPNAHAPLADGKCFDCHAPHVGEGKALLIAGGSALCRRCHDPRDPATQAAHAKAGAGTAACESCHPHHAPRAVAPKRR
ncbi:MAG TPA: cytochrome c3 family protein [Anaeromyxobacteraceae bacterium]|nr:cytochrome c3 family protein [Anaeromyxobacteraceae bacterium]